MFKHARNFIVSHYEDESYEGVQAEREEDTAVEIAEKNEQKTT